MEIRRKKITFFSLGFFFSIFFSVHWFHFLVDGNSFALSNLFHETLHSNISFFNFHQRTYIPMQLFFFQVLFNSRVIQNTLLEALRFGETEFLSVQLHIFLVIVVLCRILNCLVVAVNHLIYDMPSMMAELNRFL